MSDRERKMNDWEKWVWEKWVWEKIRVREIRVRVRVSENESKNKNKREYERESMRVSTRVRIREWMSMREPSCIDKNNKPKKENIDSKKYNLKSDEG
jgi:hypothetical protein